MGGACCFVRMDKDLERHIYKGSRAMTKAFFPVTERETPPTDHVRQKGRH